MFPCSASREREREESLKEHTQQQCLHELLKAALLKFNKSLRSARPSPRLTLACEPSKEPAKRNINEIVFGRVFKMKEKQREKRSVLVVLCVE